MRLSVEVGGSDSEAERRVDLVIGAHELATAYLHLAQPAVRNRTGLYMRRHPSGKDTASVGPNEPLRSLEEPPKLTILEHLSEMREAGLIPAAIAPSASGSASFGVEPIRLAVPISDLVANLLRPSFHRDRLGHARLFFLDGEPIDRMTYWCACFFETGAGRGRLDLRWVRFDAAADRALDHDGRDLLEAGLVWAAALVPLVVHGRGLTAVEITPYDYDLRQILGREAEPDIRHAYEGWFDDWRQRTTEATARFELGGRQPPQFYHSVLGLDHDDNIVIRQVEADLPGLAATLAREGVRAAGVLDSGGSCAIYDVSRGHYLNHGWYFREPRGAIIVLELTIQQRIPQDRATAWIRRRNQQFTHRAHGSSTDSA